MYNMCAGVRLIHWLMPSDIYMRQYINSPLVQLKIYRLFGTKALSEPCWRMASWNIGNILQCDLNQNVIKFSYQCHLRNNGHFALAEIASMCYRNDQNCTHCFMGSLANYLKYKILIEELGVEYWSVFHVYAFCEPIFSYAIFARSTQVTPTNYLIHNFIFEEMITFGQIILFFV